MHVGVEYFVSVSAILFGIGLFGVFTRRSPLILLLSVELMLNACNLTLIAFSRYLGEQSRPGVRADRDGASPPPRSSSASAWWWPSPAARPTSTSTA